MRVASLTGLRGVAAVSVLLYHIPHQPAFAQFAIPPERVFVTVEPTDAANHFTPASDWGTEENSHD